MKEIIETIGKVTKVTREFDSLNEFYTWLQEQPVNKVFKPEEKHLRSHDNNKEFRGTSSFDSAVWLMKHGWSEGIEKINQKLSGSKINAQNKLVSRPTYGIQGYQASVPRYLQGIPDSMVSTKRVNVKQKVVTLTKNVTYAWTWDKEDIINESVKAVQIVNKLESQGTRCNVNIILGLSDKANHKEYLKIRVKSANERLNVSKLAFPLAHPSMLRRLLFNYIEVSKTVTSGFRWGYGIIEYDNTIKKLLDKQGEILLPTKFEKDIESITSVEDIM